MSHTALMRQPLALTAGSRPTRKMVRDGDGTPDGTSPRSALPSPSFARGPPRLEPVTVGEAGGVVGQGRNGDAAEGQARSPPTPRRFWADDARE